MVASPDLPLRREQRLGWRTCSRHVLAVIVRESGVVANAFAEAASDTLFAHDIQVGFREF
jgi:hypothetical protein